MQEYGVTEMVIVGDAFGRPLVAALAEAEQAGKPYDISSLRRIGSSGVAWSIDVKRALLARGSMLLADNISASEGGPFANADARTEADLADSRFTLAPVARVLDENDQDVVPGSGQVGVLASAGPQPVGYLGDPERTARTWRVIDGVRYAMPGDLATLDADGKLGCSAAATESSTPAGRRSSPRRSSRRCSPIRRSPTRPCSAYRIPGGVSG